jgi:SanA protein
VCLLLFLVGLPLGLRAWTDWQTRSRVFALDQAPPRSVAIVFGAGYWPGYGLSDILEDRVVTAAGLYHQGKVRKLLLTGDNRTLDYNEPGAMRARALELGVPDADIVLDYAGRRTYDSCYRARHIFAVEDAILVTQAYHLDRALFTARGLGVDAVGVAADRRDYQHIKHYWWRELAATAVAWWQVEITRPEPVLGDRLPIVP